MSVRSGKTVKTKADQDKDRDGEVVLDLASFVMEVERFSTLIEPFAFIFYAIDDIRRLVMHCSLFDFLNDLHIFLHSYVCP